MSRSLKPPQSPLAKVRAFYEIFGWKVPAITMVGLGFSVIVALIPLINRKPISWLEETALATFAGGITLFGVSSLCERWVSLAPLAGFPVRRPRPRPWLGAAGLSILGGVLLIGWLVEPLPNKRMRLLVPLLGACCLIGALGVVLICFRGPLHVLVREGLALRYRQGWSLIPWERMARIAVGTYYENVVATIELSHLLTPLPTVWRREEGEEQRQRWLERQLRGFETARRWVGADVIIWKWWCKIPPGLFVLQVQEALSDPVARQRFPTFEQATGMAPALPLSQPHGE
jgi:hypothetical protein